MYMRMKSFLLIFSNIFHRISLFAQRKPVRLYIVRVSILNDRFDNVSHVRGIVKHTRHASGSTTPRSAKASQRERLLCDPTFARSLELLSLSHLSETVLVLDCVG